MKLRETSPVSESLNGWAAPVPSPANALPETADGPCC
jgi:hypothetical protein